MCGVRTTICCNNTIFHACVYIWPPILNNFAKKDNNANDYVIYYLSDITYSNTTSDEYMAEYIMAGQYYMFSIRCVSLLFVVRISVAVVHSEA